MNCVGSCWVMSGYWWIGVYQYKQAEEDLTKT